MKSITALAVGHVTLDRYPHGLEPGGSALYATRLWQSLDVNTRLYTAVGHDFDQPEALAGLHKRVTVEGQTTRFENVYGPDGRTMRLHARASLLDPSALPRAWAAPDILFLAPVFGEVPLDRWLPRRAGVLGVGLQGVLKVRRADGTVCSNPRQCDPRSLQGADIVCLSDEDLSGDSHFLRALIATVPTVALTRGAAGSTLFHHGQVIEMGVCSTHAVDPTGAGDTFAAGLLYGCAMGYGMASATRLATAAASIAVEYQASAPQDALGQAPQRVAQVGLR